MWGEKEVCEYIHVSEVRREDGSSEVCHTTHVHTWTNLASQGIFGGRELVRNSLFSRITAYGER